MHDVSRICGVLYLGMSAMFVMVDNHKHVMFKYANQFGQIRRYKVLLSCLGMVSQATYLYEFRFRLKGMLGHCTHGVQI